MPMEIYLTAMEIVRLVSTSVGRTCRLTVTPSGGKGGGRGMAETMAKVKRKKPFRKSFTFGWRWGN